MKTKTGEATLKLAMEVVKSLLAEIEFIKVRKNCTSYDKEILAFQVFHEDLCEFASLYGFNVYYDNNKFDIRGKNHECLSNSKVHSFCKELEEFPYVKKGSINTNINLVVSLPKFESYD